MKDIITEIPERKWYDFDKDRPLALTPIIIRFKCFHDMETRNGFVKFNKDDFHYHVGVVLTKEQGGFDGVFQEFSTSTVKEVSHSMISGTWLIVDSEWSYV